MCNAYLISVPIQDVKMYISFVVRDVSYGVLNEITAVEERKKSVGTLCTHPVCVAGRLSDDTFTVSFGEALRGFILMRILSHCPFTNSACC